MADTRQIRQRASQAPKVTDESFDLDCLYMTLQQLVKKYDIRYDPDNPVPSDDQMADRVWAAAIDFFVNCGVYYKDTGGVLKFTRTEVLEIIADYDGDCHFGEGKEARIFRSRKPDSNSRPWCLVGSGIVASSEDIAYKIVYGNACVEQADFMSVCALNEIDGEPIVAGKESEVRGAVRSLEVARKAIKDSGREGLAIINGIATAASAAGTIEAARVALKPSDAIIVGSLAEFKTSDEMLRKVEYGLDSGTNIVLASAPMVGGYGGGPEAVAILNSAYALFGIMVYQCDYYLSLPLHIRYSCSTTRDVIWAMALSAQALARNTNIPTLGLCYAAGGPWTESFYYESAAHIAACVTSGVSIQTPHPAKAVRTHYVTPLEMKTTTGMAMGCAGMTRKEANQVVKALLPKYEQNLATAPIGKTYTECFDLETGTAKGEYLDFVEKIKNMLSIAAMPL